MTTPNPPLLDQGNQLLGETPAQMAAAPVDGPAGQRLALTIRTASTTLTVLLNAGDARAWAESLTAAAKQMSAAGLLVAAPGLMPNGNGARR